MGLLYRWRQFWQALAARPLPLAAKQEIATILSGPEIALFQRLSLNDQCHSYQVMEMLRQAGQRDRDLLAAALLHDIGKTRYELPIWARSLVVLAQAFVPSRVAVWGQGEAKGWRRPFVVKAQHAAWGAEMAEAAGSRPRTVELIGRHDKPVGTAGRHEEELLRRLQWADDEN
jgi:putative nucleotidyltransferase with HDIG domain